MARTHRGLFWTAVAVSVVLVGGGTSLAYVGYEETAGPGGAVKGYFTALQHSDAPKALAYGDLPVGPRTLLTSTVLHEQQRIAPITDVHVERVNKHGSTARVDVHYDLGFTGNRLSINDTIPVARRGTSWRLVRAAAITKLDMVQARDRATVVGAPVPEDEMLVFPGAAPVVLDTKYLQIDPDSSIINLSSTDDTVISVSPSPEGRDAAHAALTKALKACLNAGADPKCPRPSVRSVPGSARATLPSNAADQIGVVVKSDDSGVMQMLGSLRVTGHYSVLNFSNVASPKRGAFRLQIDALAYPRSPITIQWQQEKS